MTPRYGDTPLAAAMRAYVKRLDRGGKHITAARVAEVWPEAVGADIDRHTTGVFLRDGELIAYVDSPVWATELSAMAEPLRQAVNQALGEESVRAVRFIVSKRVVEDGRRAQAEKETDEFYSEDVVESVPLDPQELEQVRQSASVIKDARLREAAVRATVKDLEWKRGLERREASEKRAGNHP